MSKLILADMLLVMVIFGVVAVVVVSTINQNELIDAWTGKVVSKQVVANSPEPNTYSVKLDLGKTLYIIDNPSLMESIVENQTYTFNCHIDLQDKMSVVDSATLANPAK